MTHDQIEDVIPLYAAGALDRLERHAIESHLLAGCSSCHSLMREYHGVASLLAFALPTIAPPPKAAILAPILRATEAVDEPPTFAMGGWWHTVARMVLPRGRSLSLLLLLVAACTGWYAWSTHQRLQAEQQERSRLERAFQEAQTQIAALQDTASRQEQALSGIREEFMRRLGTLGEAEDKLFQREAELDLLRVELAHRDEAVTALKQAVAQRDDMLMLLKSGHVKVVPLTGLDQAKAAAAFVLFDVGTRKAFLYAFNMPPLPPGKTYQVWAVGDKPVSAGIFTIGKSRSGRIVMKTISDLASVTRFAVSIEPEGGAMHPTGQIYLTGTG